MPKKLEPLAISGIVVYENAVKIGNKDFLVVMKSLNNRIVIHIRDAQLSENFVLELTEEHAESLMGGQQKYGTLANLLSITEGKLVVQNDFAKQIQKEKSEKDEKKLEEDLKNARVIKGLKDIVGGYVLNYNPTEIGYSKQMIDSRPVSDKYKEDKAKEFVFVSNKKEDELGKWLQIKVPNQTQILNPSIITHRIDSASKLTRQDSSGSCSSSSLNMSIRKPTKLLSTQGKSIALGDFLSQTTGLSSIRKQYSDSDSILSSVGLEVRS